MADRPKPQNLAQETTNFFAGRPERGNHGLCPTIDLRPNLMFLVGVLALGRVLWWMRTLHIEIWRPRDNFLHAGFLSPPVSDRALPGYR
eukprot:scaffold119762_cov87-Phaeocystis_antarctica.AAC.1